MDNELIIERTGKPALKILKGEKVASYTTRDHEKISRWFEAELYRTGSGKYVCMIKSATTWPNENQRNVAEPFEDGSALAAWLDGLTPWTWFLGFPPGDQFIPKQKRLVEELKGQYARLVTEILKAVPESAIEVS